ncbi:MAG: cytochrome c [Bacteroidetes bacterium]|nr:MAG: cytochrome c [Bacteroidota bacterium]
MNKKIFAGLSVSLILIAYSCTKDKAPEEPTPLPPGACADTVSFSGVIEPLFQQKCFSCHDQNGGTSPLLKDHATISSNASSIYAALKGEGVTRMPNGGPYLADSTIEMFNCWVVQGKLNN